MDQREKKRLTGFGRIGLLSALLLLLPGCGAKQKQTEQALAAIQDMDYQGALVLLDQAAAEGEDDKRIRRARGIAYMGLGAYETATDCFLEALSLSDGWVEKIDYDINLYLAVSYVKQGMPDEALAVYDSILALEENQKDALMQRGNVYLAEGRFPEAQADFEHLIGLNANDFDTLIAVYESLAAYGKKDVGKNYLRQALEQSEEKMSNYDKGRIYYYLEQYQQAYLALESAKDKGGAKAALFLGRSYEATGDYNYAISVYLSTLDKDGESAAVYNQLGLCYMARQNYEEAIAALEKGIALSDGSVQQSLLFNRAVCYEYCYDFAAAEQLFRQYLAAYPDDEQAKREYDFLSTR